ncbi:MAG: type II toxin-antitoxin system death-on-curing family toxin [Gammaproteobacteria bacterium]|nr:type II toxin-antitoxin system death-on-curing family toxin [Gammaproteobacteria bacterium]
MAPTWLSQAAVLAMHERLLAEHGGTAGIRDPGLLDSALARPRQHHAYGDPDPFDMAAAYAAGIIRNHPFVDGNKRTGFMSAYVFLALNGVRTTAAEVDVVRVVTLLAANEIDEAAFAAWLRDNSETAA